MVCFRGVDVSLFAVVDGQETKVPEYPHPDGSSVNLSSTSIDKHGSAQFNSPRRGGSPLRADHLSPLKANPKMSVYVPSVPDTQFFLKYSINMPAPDKEKPYLFFKLFMNGRHIVAWGIDRRKVQSGETYRALYEPCEHFQHKENDMLLQAPGVEARHFKFAQKSREKTVAEDGGIIEVQIFRARARRRQPIELSKYRHQEKYGISGVSDGLIDKPEDTAFYQWYLFDAVDSPYASFRFHYRTWQNLRQLQLVRDDDVSLFSSGSAASFATAISHETVKENCSDSDIQHFSFGQEEAVPSHTSLDDNKENIASPPERRQASYALNTPPLLPPNPTPSDSIPQPSKADRDAIASNHSIRPLPEIPVYRGPPASRTTETFTYKSHRRSESAFSGLTTASRKSSKSSITPSLMPYVDDATFLTDDVELGVAKKVEVLVQHDPSRHLADSRTVSQDSSIWQTEESLSEYSSSPLPSDDSAGVFRRGPQPREYVALQHDADRKRFSSPPRGVSVPIELMLTSSPRSKLQLNRGPGCQEKETAESVKVKEGCWMASHLPAALGEAMIPPPPTTPPSPTRRPLGRSFSNRAHASPRLCSEYRKSDGEMLYQESLQQNMMTGRDVDFAEDVPPPRSPRSKSPRRDGGHAEFPSWI